MPVLLRSVGFGRSNNSRGLRPGSQNSAGRRVSQVSNTPTSASASTRQSQIDKLDNRIIQKKTSSDLYGASQYIEYKKSRVHDKADDDVEAPKPTWGERLHKIYKKYHIKYLFPLVFIMIYMMIGAILFYFLESGAAEKVAMEEDYKYKRERRLLLLRMEELVEDPAARKRAFRKEALEEAIVNYEKKLDFAVKNESQWSLMSAMYFAGTLFTTIGYGDIACVTTSGRIATVIYSCVGIPFMLITLNDLGKFLYNNINGCVKSFDDFSASLGVFRICSAWRRTNTNVAKIDELVQVESGTLAADVNEVSSLASEMGSERNASDYESIEDEEERAMPRMSVKVALGITIGWIFFCSALFKLWEHDWTYGESCYFMFISLSTIGLGDLSVSRRDMMVLCFVFVIVGLSLVSMTINVIQVALEDFYVNLMMKLIIEYQEKLAAGGDQMGASVGMMRMWGNNKTAKYLMPLLSKEKKKMAMEKIEVKAKENGMEVPAILTDLDEKSGMPKLFHIDDSEKDGDDLVPPKILEEMVQRQIDIDTAAAETVQQRITHDANTQTDIQQTEEKGDQTDGKVCEEQSVQTEIVDDSEETFEIETQTDDISSSIAETQTPGVDQSDEATNTTTAVINSSEMQTDTVITNEQDQQTYIDMIDEEVVAIVESKNIRIQTPNPVIEQKSVQTEDIEERRSPSKMSTAKRRLRRAFASKSRNSPRGSSDHPVMSEWKDVEEEEMDEEGAGDEESVESLHWDPVDGMHAEKQLPVKKLKAMFDSPKGDRKVERKFSSFSRKPEGPRPRNQSE